MLKNQNLTQRLVSIIIKNGSEEEKEFILMHDELTTIEDEKTIIIKGYNFITDSYNEIIYYKKKENE